MAASFMMAFNANKTDYFVTVLRAGDVFFVKKS